jgi:hypothetical protein
MVRNLCTLGTRGVPAAHGGFGTFAERLASCLVESRRRVTACCKVEGAGPCVRDRGRGMDRVLAPARVRGAASDDLGFLGAVCSGAIVQTLCLHRSVDLHLHPMGGIHFSLIEALSGRRAPAEGTP